MHTITKLRLYLQKSQSRFLDLLIGLLLGLVIVPVAKGITFLFGFFDQTILLTVCSLLSVIVLALTVYLIFLKNRLKSYTKIIKELDPTMDIHAHEEYSIGWEEAEKNNKDK